jgi:hypothetical protein
MKRNDTAGEVEKSHIGLMWFCIIEILIVIAISIPLQEPVKIAKTVASFMLMFFIPWLLLLDRLAGLSVVEKLLIINLVGIFSAGLANFLFGFLVMPLNVITFIAAPLAFGGLAYLLAKVIAK